MEIVKGSILIAENFQGERGVADKFIVRIDSDAGSEASIGTLYAMVP